MKPLIRPSLAALLAVTVAVAPIAAQAEWRRIAPLTGEQRAQVRQTMVARGDLARLIDHYIPYFKVAATESTVMVCSLRYGAFECWQESRGRVCPTSVEIRVDGVPSPATVPITCFGPDTSGECECDFASQ